jgi:hypothetical protein
MDFKDLKLIKRIQNLQDQVSQLDPSKKQDVAKMKALKEKELPSLLEEASKKAPFATEMLRYYFDDKNNGKKTIDLKKSPLWKSAALQNGKKRIGGYLNLDNNELDLRETIQGAGFTNRNNTKEYASTRKKIKDAFKKDPNKKVFNIKDQWESWVVSDHPNIESWFGLGSYTLKGLFTGIATKVESNLVSVKGKVDYKIKDRYNWDPAKATLLPFGLGKIEDESLSKFAKAGLAKSFDVDSTVVTEKIETKIKLDERSPQKVEDPPKRQENDGNRT